LMWTLLLLLVISFMVAMVITQIVAHHLIVSGETEAVKKSLTTYWGDVTSSILVLFQAITGGVDWRDCLTPLMQTISPLMAVPVCLYVGFCIFALMNVVTGVFVESALECAEKEKERFLLHTVRELFKTTDVDNSGDISWDEFQDKIDTPEMHLYFKTIDLDIDEAEDLFRLIDIDMSGSIDPEEFVNGCIRLQGPAKAIDLATLMSEFKRTTMASAHRSKKMMDTLKQGVAARRQERQVSSGDEHQAMAFMPTSHNQKVGL